MSVFYPKALATLRIIFEGAPDDRPLVVTARPKSFTVHLNGYKEADTFELEFDAAMLPFSPDIIRGGSVEISLWNSPDLYQDEIDVEAWRSNSLLVAGAIDEANIHFDESGRWFRLAGRDYTALMLDHVWNPKLRVPQGKPLKDVVQYLVDIGSGVKTVDQHGNVTDTGHTQVLKVKMADELPANTSAKDTTNVTGKDKHYKGGKKKGKVRNPTVGSSYAKTNKKGIPVRKGANVWDVIYRLCVDHGLIVYVIGTDVVIDSPHVLTQTSKDRAIQVAYGRNLKSLAIERKLGKETVPQIKIISYDRTGRQPISAVFPDPPDTKTTAIGTKKEEIQVYTVPGITSKAQCLQIAQLRYEALARTEALIKFETMDMKDLQGTDLTQLRPGDPVAISFEDIQNEDFKSLNSASQRSAAMRKLGYSAGISYQVGVAFEAVLRERAFFYTKSVAVSYDVSSGVSFSVEAVNYVSPARDDKQNA